MWASGWNPSKHMLLIQTKLQSPIVPPNTLPRSPLIERLNNGRYRKLTLISAPAGYGKTVLASLWQAACDCPVAWFSLDKNDNETGVFLRYFVSAIQSVFPDACEEMATWITGLQQPPIDILLTTVASEIAQFNQPFLLVLDDYHWITNPDIHQIVNAIIQYQSQQMHLVLATRQDPPINIVNLRAKDQITEIRLADLQFNGTEAEQYLRSNLDADISREFIQKLFKQTKGWAVGLRLSTLALRNQIDREQFLERSQTPNTYLMSYFLNEVLAQLPKPVQTFLLYTSILDRFCAPLCGAILPIMPDDEHISHSALLAQLQQDNMFTISLDSAGEWFRYHHLFQDLLHHQLQLVCSAIEIEQLHKKACHWLLEQNFIEEALDHAFQSGDMQLAVHVLAQAKTNLLNNTQWQRLAQFLNRFPQDIIDQSPPLLMMKAWLIYHHGQYTKLPLILAHLQAVIDRTPFRPEETQALQGEMSALYSLLDYLAMDLDRALMYGEKSLELTAPDLWVVRVFARLLIAVTQQANGDLAGAYATIFSSFDLERIQHNALTVVTLVTACHVDWMAANFKNLQHNTAQIIELCRKGCSTGMQGQGHYHKAIVAYSQNDLPTAEHHFKFVVERSYANYGDIFGYSACGLALVYLAEGKEASARKVIDQAIAFFLTYGNTFMLAVMQSFEAEVALRFGRLSDAQQWADQMEVAPSFAPMHKLYNPHFTLVKVWLMQDNGRSDDGNMGNGDVGNGRLQAIHLLNRLETFLQATHNTIFLQKTFALKAVYYQLEGDEPTALNYLTQALSLSMPINNIRLYSDLSHLGPPVATLLNKKKAITPESELADHITTILAAIYPSTHQSDLVQMPEPLTDREMDVLRLLNQRYTNREIAQKLEISSHTVNSHTKAIYQKLSVSNRREAVVRSQKLGLIA